MRQFLHAVGVAGLLMSFQPDPVHASVLITAVETGGNVVFSYSGSIDIVGLGLPDFFGVPTIAPRINPPFGVVLFTNGPSIDVWVNASYHFPAFGAGGLASADTASGDVLGVFANGFGIEPDYISGTTISGSMTYLSQSFLSLGLTVGTYVLNLPSDTLTLNIGAVPEPASLALLGAGLAGLAGVRRRARG